MKKLIIALLFSLILMIPTAAGAASLENGEPIGDVMSTDIKAYINGSPIPSFNIGGTTVVMANDLKSYGFDVNWNEGSREVIIKLNPTKEIKALPKSNDNSVNDVGRVLSKVLYTDISVFLDGRKVVSYNVNGSTALYISDLSLYGNVVWDGEKRQINVTLDSKPQKDPLAFLNRTPDGKFTLTSNTDKEIRAVHFTRYKVSSDSQDLIKSDSDASQISIAPRKTVTFDKNINPQDAGFSLKYVHVVGQLDSDIYPSFEKYDSIMTSDRVSSYYKSLDAVMKAKEAASKAEEPQDKKVDFKTQSLNGPSYNELMKNSSKHLGTSSYFSGKVIYASEDSSGKTSLLIDISAGANDILDLYNRYSDDPNYVGKVESKVLAVFSDNSVDILKDDMVEIYGTVLEQSSYKDGYGNSLSAPTLKLVKFKRTNMRKDELIDLMKKPRKSIDDAVRGN
jgi:hypothetical protein